MGYTFGSASKACLDEAHTDLQAILNLGIRLTPVDFSIIETARSMEQAQINFDTGASKLDPRKGQISKHVVAPSIRDLAEAVDIAIYHPNINIRRQIIWDFNHLSLVAGVLLSVAQDLLFKKKIRHRLRWGGNWDSDGVIIKDQNFNDLAHFELLEIER